MPSKFVYTVKVGRDVLRPEEVYVVAAYSREEAIEAALGKFADVEIEKNKKSQTYFKVGNLVGEVLVVWHWRKNKMVRKTDVRNAYIQIRDGYYFENEDDVRDYLETYKYPGLRDWIVFIDKFGRSENVKKWVL